MNDYEQKLLILILGILKNCQEFLALTIFEYGVICSWLIQYPWQYMDYPWKIHVVDSSTLQCELCSAFIIL